MIAAPLPSLAGAVLYAALSVLLGALALRWLVQPRLRLASAELAPVERSAAGAALLAAVVLLLVVPARVALQLADFLEPGEPWRPALSTILFSTQSGKAAQLQMVWATAATLAFAVARAGRVRGWRAAGVAGLVLAMTPALGGHAAASARPVLAMTIATLHVLGAGIWVGTLFHLWRISRVASDRTLRALLAGFHRVALSAAAVLALTGLYAAATTIATPADLVRTAWGGLLLGKLALVAGVAGFGAWHWRTAERRVDAGGRAALTRSFAIELGLAALVVGVTGFLAGTAPPE